MKHATVSKTSTSPGGDREAKHGGPGGSRGTGREAESKMDRRGATSVQGEAFSLHKLPSRCAFNTSKSNSQAMPGMFVGGAGRSGGEPAAAPAAPEGLMAVPDSRRYLSAFFAYLRGPGCYISRNGIFIVPFLFLSGILKDPSK